jgi:hypothetical protein
MRAADVVRLAERLLGHLPVGLDDLGDVRLDVTVLEVPHREVIGKSADEIHQRRRVRVGIDEHEAGPRADRALGEAEVVRPFVHVREIPRRRDIGECTVDRPGEAVERATDLRAMPVVVLELAATVQARIGVRLDRTSVCADHHE